MVMSGVRVIAAIVSGVRLIVVVFEWLWVVLGVRVGRGGVWCSEAVVVSGVRVVWVGVVVVAASGLPVYRPVGMKRQTRHIPHPRNIPR
jgi:hypothetical protein